MVALAHYITAVRTADGPSSAHEHIALVRLSDGTIQPRSEVITNILVYRMIYMTSAPGVPSARVIVARCPHCAASDYITTEPDYTTANNLLDLPRF